MPVIGIVEVEMGLVGSEQIVVPDFMVAALF